ncbi:hypothetical protein L9F63_017439, partial [Diploptera punctata]
MSREAYGTANLSSVGGNRSPRSARRVGELPTVDRSPSRSYPSSKTGRPRSGTASPDHQHAGYMGSPYYKPRGRTRQSGDDGRTGAVYRHGGRPPPLAECKSTRHVDLNPMSTRYQSLDRAIAEGHDREFMPIREPRERSLDRSGGRERSLERGMYLEDEMYGSRSARQSPNPHMMTSSGRDASTMYIDELQAKNNDLQRELGNFKKELELTNQKLGSSMHSIKTFWSPELKKERALRKEESAKYSLINDQLKLLNSENQIIITS